ncbi:MAG TPA: hypothetical protein VF362_04090 [Demequinaceae bacterium]
MIPVSAQEVGPVALARMLRDGVLAPLAPRHGMPRDVPESSLARALCLSPVVPAHTVVSGLAGLWVRHGGAAPSVADLVGARGLHRAKPGAEARGWTLVFHSGGAATGPRTEFGGIVVASAERCAADALRWRDLATAIEVVFLAVRAGSVEPAAIEALVVRDDPRGHGAARARYAWGALAATLGPSPTANPEGGVCVCPSAPGGECP